MRRILFIVGIFTFGFNFSIKAQDLIVKFKSKINFGSASSIELATMDSSFVKFPHVEIRPLMIESLRRFKNLRKDRIELYSKLGIDRWTTFSVSKKIDPQKLLVELRTNPAVEYAQLNHVYHIHQLPDDPRISDQWSVRPYQRPNP